MNEHPSVLRLRACPQWAQRTPEWYEKRKSLITASDAAGALGIGAANASAATTRRNLLKQKIENTFKGNAMTRHGQNHEDFVREKLEDILGEPIEEFGLLVHPDLDWLGASPDGLSVRSGLLVEIKCPYRREIVPGEVPHHYWPQVQCQMEVCDVNACLFAQWQPAHLSSSGKEILDIAVVERDHEWFLKVKDTLHGFWADVMEGRANHVPRVVTCSILDNLYDDLSPAHSDDETQ